MPIPEKGRAAAEILKDLDAHKANDLPWTEGRVFAYIYDAGDEAMGLLKDAFTLFLTENGLDPTSFPSCMELEKDVIDMALDLVHGGPNANGSFTSGGTESIMLSVKTARDRARELQPEIEMPEIILPETAHAAFYKSCHYLGLKPVRVDVDPVTYQAIPEKIAEAITPNTVMLVASAPSYAHGVIDPVGEIAALAKKNDLLCHVDCCVGGMYLPFAKKLGYDIPEFDLGVDGVTQLSMDFHKWGYAAKGASAILYKDGELRRHQIFSWSGWTGYTVINPTVTSTKGGGPVAACWAILNHLGMEGYTDLVEKAHSASEKIRSAIRDIDGIELLGSSNTNLFSFRATDFDIFALSDAMKKKDWFIQPQFGFSCSPANMHLSVGPNNAPHVDEFLVDLKEEVGKIRHEQNSEPLKELPAEIAALLENPSPDVFDMLTGPMGTDGSDLPQEMREINNLLNVVPAATRDMILIEFINRLYVK